MWQRQDRPRKTLSFDEAKYKAAAYCSLAEHCPYEVREKLAQWGLPSADHEALIDFLIDENYLSEERFCRAFVNDKVRFQGWGFDKIRQALFVKRLPSACIQTAIEAFPEEEYADRLRQIAEKKMQSIHDDDPRAQRDKLVRFLVSRGFSFRDIAALGRIDTSDYED